MTRFTLAQIRSQIQLETDTQDETFVDDSECDRYINDAIDEIEKEILAVNQDYFLTSASLPITAGTSEYSLPTNIYAQKIRGLQYSSGSLYYPITRIKNWHKFDEIANINQFSSSTTRYQFLIRHDTATKNYKIVLYPAAQETSSTAITVWYMRNANELVYDTDVCDIPEGLQFIKAHAKMSILAKEFGGIAPQEAVAEMQRQKQLLLDILADQTPDAESDLVETDLTSYVDHN